MLHVCFPLNRVGSDTFAAACINEALTLSPSCAAIDKSTPCSTLFGAPLGTFSWPSAGKLGRKQKCGGDEAWAAKNPPSPATTCKGFLHCHFVDAKVSLCERTRDLVTGPLDTCKRVGEGVQCGGDEAFMKKVGCTLFCTRSLCIQPRTSRTFVLCLYPRTFASSSRSVLDCNDSTCMFTGKCEGWNLL